MEDCHYFKPGSVFVLNLGEALHFHAPGIWQDSRLSLIQPEAIEQNALPQEFRNETPLLLLRKRNVDYFIAPNLQKACSTNDNNVSYFKFPYRSIWKNQDEYHCWLSGWEFRPRKSIVDERALRERNFSGDFLRSLMSMPQNQDVVTALQGTGETNVQITVAGDLTNGLPQQVQQARVRVVGTVPDRYVHSVRFEYCANGQNILRYCYDRVGRLKWFSSERAVQGDGETILEDRWVFEYDDNGMLLRCLCPGQNPLLVISDRTFYFSGEHARIRQFINDVFEATKDIL